MKRQVLHRERAHLKVPGCSLVLSALLTKKLPTFLSRLNEISGGCEKILPVSESFWSNLSYFKNDTFDYVIMRMESEGEWNSVILIFFVTFVVLTVDQIVGRDNGPL